MNKKTVIVTGASSGIGLAVAKAFLAKGYNVVGNSRSIEKLQKTLKEFGSAENLLLVDGDIGQPETAKKVFAEAIKRFKKVDVLVNNAGIFNAKPFTEYSKEEVDTLVSTNLYGFIYPTQEAVKHMSANASGHIINITASIAEQPLKQVPATIPILIKGGLNQATKALALELSSQNIKVSAVAPGIVDTALYTKDMHGFLKTLQPIGRIGHPEEIAEAVLYLASAEFTTGVVLPVDGGMSAGRW